MSRTATATLSATVRTLMAVVALSAFTGLAAHAAGKADCETPKASTADAATTASLPSAADALAGSSLWQVPMTLIVSWPQETTKVALESPEKAAEKVLFQSLLEGGLGADIVVPKADPVEAGS